MLLLWANVVYRIVSELNQIKYNKKKENKQKMNGRWRRIRQLNITRKYLRSFSRFTLYSLQFITFWCSHLEQFFFFFLIRLISMTVAFTAFLFCQFSYCFMNDKIKTESQDHWFPFENENFNRKCHISKEFQHKYRCCINFLGCNCKVYMI